ncbi:MAG: MFS transporter [Chloroflexi bacterium]|nr:MFS transporter [Chloroflexota bacterium]
MAVAARDEASYKRCINAWAMYDWANSAFATTILASLLPIYYSTVAGSTLPSEATATAYWSLTISFSLFVLAILSPILGTVSDVMRNKKRFLSIFVGLGVVGTGLLVFVNTGDWLLASLVFVLGRIGFGGSIVFYDALLPHVARPQDRDWVSTRGYALGYLGGGLLLAINVAMYFFIPDSLFENAGLRLSFLSVAVWWLVFSLPLLRRVPEPPSLGAALIDDTVLGASIKRLRTTFGNIRKYRELFKYLVAFLIYNDAIGTIIAVAAIYGAELGFELTELVLAILLVQFAGIPFSIIFGRLPAHNDSRAPFYLAFILINAIALPVLGLGLAASLPADVSGAQPLPYLSMNTRVGEGSYALDRGDYKAAGNWRALTFPGADLVGEGLIGSLTAALTGVPDDLSYALSDEIGATQTLLYNGQHVQLTYRRAPDGGLIGIRLDGDTLLDAAGQPVIIDTYGGTVRYGETTTLEVAAAGEHALEIVNASSDPERSAIAVSQVEVEVATRQSSLPTIAGIILAFEVLALAVAWLAKSRFVGLSNWLDTRRSILLSLLVYGIIACWGFLLNSTVEFWMLALMVAMVQGGSQALSRSLYASLCPKAKSGEFFGFYAIMEKFAAIIGPLIFAFAGIALGSTRPAILSLILLFLLGGYMLSRVDISAGQRLAQEEDAEHGLVANH